MTYPRLLLAPFQPTTWAVVAALLATGAAGAAYLIRTTPTGGTR